jgi:DNA processing protein
VTDAPAVIPPFALVTGNPDHELAALVVLNSSKSVKLDRVGSESEASNSAVALLYRVARETALAPRFDDNDISRALELVKTWRTEKRDVRTVLDRNYPLNLRDIIDKPPLIFVRGTWREDRDSVGVAVVGTRKPSEFGLRDARDAAFRLAKAGVTVVSGLAIGIDTAAHTAALDGGGRTVAVMGTGIDRVYPPENGKLAQRIVTSGGALISQFFPDDPPAQWSFPMRNVVMSGLALATYVIEASETSGAKRQARAALEHGRTVFLPTALVRGHAWARKFAEEGIRGAKAVEVPSVDDVIERLKDVTYDEPMTARLG